MVVVVVLARKRMRNFFDFVTHPRFHVLVEEVVIGAVPRHRDSIEPSIGACQLTNHGGRRCC